MRFRRSIKIFPGLRQGHGKKNSDPPAKAGKPPSPGLKVGAINPEAPLDQAGDVLPESTSPQAFRAHNNPESFRSSWSLDQAPSMDRSVSAVYTHAFDGVVNQHRQIKAPPANQRDAYLSFFSPPPPLPKKIQLVSLLSAGALIVSLALGLGAPVLLGIAVVFLVSLFIVRRRRSVREEWEVGEKRKNELIESALSGHFTAMEEIFCQILKGMDWVLETSASFEISLDGKSMSIDVKLPEIKDLEGLFLANDILPVEEIVHKKPWVIQREYQLLVHAIILRLAGEVFYHFPTVKNVFVSGYTDRLDSATGILRPEYIISVNFGRGLWTSINPAQADPVECVGLFNARREIENDAYMRSIEPFSTLNRAPLC
jgi:hypothetical protein